MNTNRKFRGYLQIYTGNGKGKTTASFGLALRAAGAGLKVYIIQFAKQGNYSEIKALKNFSDFISIKQFGQKKFIKGQPDAEDQRIASDGLKYAEKIIMSAEYQVVILDEINIALSYELFKPEELLRIIETRPKNVELILTGRNAHNKLIEKADLVTEMREIKHYYHQGVCSRVGIEK